MRKQALITWSGQFPLDMLRYDGCYPSRSEDAVAMASTIGQERRKAIVESTSSSGFTVARWESFGCDCSPLLA